MGGARYLVGHCANLLPLRSRFDARQTFSDYLTGIRQTVLDAFEHQQYPFSSLIRKLNLPRDPNRVPLANVTFNVGRSRGNLNFHGLAVEVARNPKGFVNFDLNFNVMETEAGVWLNCYYSTELFDDTTVARLLGQYQFLIEKAVSDGEQGLGELPLLSEAERRQLLVERNETAAEPPSNACIHELFEAQVARTPQATALICGAERLTYAELNRRANQLANQLRDLGVPADRIRVVPNPVDLTEFDITVERGRFRRRETGVCGARRRRR